jgi:hypothetical protein
MNNSLLGGYSLERTPQTNKNLLPGAFNNNGDHSTLTERDKFRLIEKVEDKMSFSTLDKFHRSA